MNQCQQWRDKYPTVKRAVSEMRIDALPSKGMTGIGSLVNVMRDRKHSDQGLDPYLFISDLLDKLPDDVVVVTSDATAYIVTNQVSDGRHRCFSNSGCASMGYGIAAALGAAVAGAKVLCVEGDGSIMQNLSALASLAEFKLPVNVVVLCNGGYASIKSTHRRMFGRPPLEPRPLDAWELWETTGIATHGVGWIKGWKMSDYPSKAIPELITYRDGPKLAVAELDPNVMIEPRLESRVVDGRIVSPTLDKMLPEVEE